MLPNRIELFDAARVSAPKPEEVAANAPALASAPITLVAPPRTISDVTAILDEQKPDIVKVAELTATADAPVPNGLKGPGLADFYYRRAQARALLGRDDALADAELAVSNGQGSDYANAGSRHQQLLMRRPREAGQHKRASTILAKQMAAFANKGKGKLFGLNYQAAIGYIRNGDTNAAETRNRSLPAEAQRVGDPEHLKVVADAAPRRPGSGRTTRHLFHGRASSASNKRAAFEYEGPGVNPHSKRKRQNEKPGNRPGAR